MNKEEFQGFRERFNRFENGFNELVKDQNKKNAKWDILTQQYNLLKDAEKQEIKLDVGGVRFTTTKTTLLSKNSTFFNSLLDSTDPVIYIDRPGKYFNWHSC